MSVVTYRVIFSYKHRRLLPKVADFLQINRQDPHHLFSPGNPSLSLLLLRSAGEKLMAGVPTLLGPKGGSNSLAGLPW